MASNAISGIGAVIKRGDGASTEAFVTIAEVSAINGLDITRDIHDVTTLDSPSGYKEKIGGFKDAGDLVLDMNWTRAGWDIFKTDIDATASRNYKIIMPDLGATEFDFAAWASNLGKTIPTDDKISMRVTLAVDGVITETS